MDVLARLTEADASGNHEELARLAWELYGLLGEARFDVARLRAALHSVRTAA